MVIARARPDQVSRQDTTQTVSRDISWQRGKVTAEDRARLLRQRAATVWLTGLSGSGKSTIAIELEKRLTEADMRASSWMATTSGRV